MKTLLLLFSILLFAGCHNGQSSNVAAFKVPKSVYHKDEIKYTDKQLEIFLDSVGQFPTQPLADTVAFYGDSVFNHLTENVNRQIPPADFELLKKAALAGAIEARTARRIFGELIVDSTCTAKGLLDSVKKGSVYLEYIPFNKDSTKFDEFAVRVGDMKHCAGSMLYFLKGNHIIAKQDGYSRAEGVSYHEAADGHALVCREYEFGSGTGAWWDNLFFYKYDGYKLIPVLNELGNGNLQNIRPGSRIKWLESFVQKTNPLTIKMVYYLQFPDTAGVDYAPRILNDSTSVQYFWDEQSKTLKGRYQQSKIIRAQILTYVLQDNDLLFINTYNNLLKKALQTKANRRPVLNYLNEVKNDYRGN